MSATGKTAAARIGSGTGRLLIGGALALAVLAGSGPARADTTLTASYAITIGGLTIGRAEVKARFTDKAYVTAINGSTWGVSRFVSDARALLAGSGRISGATVTPGSYNLDTSESGFETQVRMAMRGGSVVSVEAVPGLIEAADRVPLTARHKNNVFDPVGAFLVALDRPGPADGNRVCNRTVKVFDGWQRFDIRLSYRETKPVSGAFDGDAIVCAARYVPVAGHRPSRESVEYMANNRRLEVWMVPVEGTNLLVPYRIVIGTQIGDLVVAARQFGTSGTADQANVN